MGAFKYPKKLSMTHFASPSRKSFFYPFLQAKANPFVNAVVSKSNMDYFSSNQWTSICLVRTQESLKIDAIVAEIIPSFGPSNF